MRLLLRSLLIASLWAAATMSAARAGDFELSASPRQDAGHDLTIPRDTSFRPWSTYLKIRKSHPDIRLFYPETPQGVTITPDVVYSSATTRPLRLDILRPSTAPDSLLPAVIMIHGGGWNSGERSMQMPMAKLLAAKGFVAIPLEYRLTPEAPYPAGLHDVKAAVRWVRAHAAELGVDPDKIALAGCSAGAQLATLAGVTNGSARHEGSGDCADTSSRVDAIVSIDGIATFISPANYEDAYGRLNNRGQRPVNSLWLGGMPHEVPDTWVEASALMWITPDSPPICFINSDLPRYSDGRDALRAIYQTLGIPSEAHRIGADFHPFWLFSDYAPATVDIMARFLNTTFSKP